eukprot:Rmarinus@m.25967
MLIPAPVAKLLGYLIGFVYPAYQSYKALETKDEEDDKQWLTYWVCYALLNIVELFEFFISWLPMYYELKLFLIVWLVFAQGATVLYDKQIRKFFLQHHATVEKHLQEGINKAKDMAANAVSGAKKD